MSAKVSHSALRISALYAVVAGLWILSSDRILSWMVQDPEQMTRLQTTKGWAFVAVTALLLYLERSLSDERLRTAEERRLQEAESSRDELARTNGRLRALMARLHVLREEESLRIAREIHDELGQLMTGIKMDLSFLRRTLGHSPGGDAGKRIDSTEQLADGAIAAIRKIATELRPAVLDTLGLAAAIEYQVQEFQKRTGIEAALAMPGELPGIGRDRSIAIVRILQESLTNVARHAAARRVRVDVRLAGSALVMEICDDGRGLAPPKEGATFGLLGMMERALGLGGAVTVRGDAGKGTVVRLTLPLGGAS